MIRSLKPLIAVFAMTVSQLSIAQGVPDSIALYIDNCAVCHGYGAIGTGGTKMKIHKAAIRRLFESNDVVLDAPEIFDLGRGIDR